MKWKKRSLNQKQRKTIRNIGKKKKVVQADKWTLIEASDNDLLLHNFEFSAKRESDIAAHIDSSFELIECVTELFTNKILRKLVNAINNFAKIKCQANNPA